MLGNAENLGLGDFQKREIKIFIKCSIFLLNIYFNRNQRIFYIEKCVINKRSVRKVDH